MHCRQSTPPYDYKKKEWGNSRKYFNIQKNDNYKYNKNKPDGT